jgi:hypothetical protein
MASQPSLEQIQAMIKVGDKEKARQALKTILFRNSQSTQAWWLYAQVAENQTQLYSILTAMSELPADTYTAKARGALARLPYHQVAKNDPIVALVHPKSTRPLLVWVGGVAAAMLVCAVLVVVFTAGHSQPTYAANASAQDNAKSAAVMRTPLPPTWTPLPEPTRAVSTQRATWTPIPTETATPVPDLTGIIPPLEQRLIKNVNAIGPLTVDTMNLLRDPNKFTKKTPLSVKTNTDKIQALYGDIMLMDTGAVPTNIRDQIVFPANKAFTDYVDSVIYWTTLATKVDQAYANLGSATDATKAQSDYENLQAQLKAQDDLIAQRQDTLTKALASYHLYVMHLLLNGTPSNQTILVDSTMTSPISLKAGLYQIAYQLDPAAPSDVVITLLSDTPNAKPIVIAKGFSPDVYGYPAGNVKVQIPAGTYHIQVGGLKLWAVTFNIQ